VAYIGGGNSELLPKLQSFQIEQQYILLGTIISYCHRKFHSVIYSTYYKSTAHPPKSVLINNRNLKIHRDTRTSAFHVTFVYSWLCSPDATGAQLRDYFLSKKHLAREDISYKNAWRFVRGDIKLNILGSHMSVSNFNDIFHYINLCVPCTISSIILKLLYYYKFITI